MLNQYFMYLLCTSILCIRKYYHMLNQYFMYLLCTSILCPLPWPLTYIWKKSIVDNYFEYIWEFCFVHQCYTRAKIVYCSLYFYACAMELQKKSLNLNFCHNFWTIRYIRFISEMHNELWNPCKLHQGQWPCDLWTAFLKTLTITITFEPMEVLLLYIYVHSLRWCLSIHTTNFDLHVVTLTLSFDLHI